MYSLHQVLYVRSESAVKIEHTGHQKVRPIDELVKVVAHYMSLFGESFPVYWGLDPEQIRWIMLVLVVEM